MSDDFERRMSDFTKEFDVAGTRKELETGAFVGARTGNREAIAAIDVGGMTAKGAMLRGVSCPFHRFDCTLV
jgi:hypothetical protein